jgi:hypothetical protein
MKLLEEVGGMILHSLHARVDVLLLLLLLRF